MLKRLLDLLIPSRCAACGARGEPCCARCEGVWGSAAEVVRVPTAGLVRVFALARYRGTARRLLIAYKERGRRDLAPSLGRALAEALAVLPLKGTGTGTAPASPSQNRPPSTSSRAHGNSSAGLPVRPAATTPGRATGAGTAPATPPQTPPPTTPNRSICLVPAPSRPSASRIRGGPHVERLAKEAATVLAARGFEVAVAPALELAGAARDAVGLGRAERVANLAGRLRFRRAGRPPPGFRIVVLDDVVTTGATAAACAQVLAAEGIAVDAVLTLLAAG